MRFDERACPQCAELIKLAARRCRHCGYQLSDEEQKRQVGPRRTVASAAGVGCLAVAALATILMASAIFSAAPNSMAEASDDEKVSARTDFQAFEKAVIAAITPCDEAGGPVAEGLTHARTDAALVELYRDAERGIERCQAAVATLGGLSVPATVPSAESDIARNALDRCTSMALARQSSLERVQTVIGVEASLAAAAKFKDDVATAQREAMMCVGRLAQLSTTLGIKPK